MKFEWDENKALQNRRKHQVSFETAALAFEDESAIIFEDDRFDYDEIREILIGRPLPEREQCLFVVFVERRENTIRIISARKATRAETNRYHEQNH
jgi:uncharacterized protein